MPVLFRFFIACLFIVFTLLPCRSHSAEAVRIAVDAYNPPNMYVKDGNAAGLYPILLKAIFKRINRDVIIEALPWKRAFAMAAAGEIGIAGIYKTIERLKIFDYSDKHHSEELLIFVKKGNTFKLNSIADLDGKRIGVIRGWSYGDEFDKARAMKRFVVEDVSRDNLSFKMLQDNRLDCVVASKVSGLLQLTCNDHFDVIALDKPLRINPVYIAFSKSTDKLELIRDINEAIRQMKADGEYNQIVADFINDFKCGEAGL